MDEKISTSSDEKSVGKQATPSRKFYHQPKLSIFGDIRDLTLAPSPGYFESGRGVNHQARFRLP